MPRPTPPVKRLCDADDITVWATGPKIPQLESMITNYLRNVSIYLKDNSVLISAPKSTVTFFTPDKHQFQMHPDITLEDTQLPLERSPKILGVIMDPSLSFHKHYNYVSDRIDKRNNMLKALAGSSWGLHKETLLLTYNALGKSIASYAAPVWSTNASDSSFKRIQTAQNAALRTATVAHKMASIDHLHQESLTLRVKDHYLTTTVRTLPSIAGLQTQGVTRTKLHLCRLSKKTQPARGWTAADICTNCVHNPCPHIWGPVSVFWSCLPPGWFCSSQKRGTSSQILLRRHTQTNTLQSFGFVTSVTNK